MVDSENKYVTTEDARELSEYIGHTIRRLLEVLVVKGIITKTDADYVGNKVDRDTWYKEATRNPAELFMELLRDSGFTPKSDMPNDKETGGTDQ